MRRSQLYCYFDIERDSITIIRETSCWKMKDAVEEDCYCDSSAKTEDNEEAGE